MMSKNLNNCVAEWYDMLENKEQLPDSLRWRELKSVQDCIREHVKHEGENFTDSEKQVINEILNIDVIAVYM